MHRALRAAGTLVLASACGFATSETDTDVTSGGPATTGTTGMPTYPPVLACAEPGSNSELVGEDCFCLDGHTWNDPFNPDDFGCHEVETRSVECGQLCHDSAIMGPPIPNSRRTCDCAIGQTWCSFENAEDTRCCDDPAQQAVPTQEPDTSSSGGGDSASSSTGAQECSDNATSSGSTAA